MSVSRLAIVVLAAALAGPVRPSASPLLDPAARPELHERMAAHTRLYYGVHAAPFGIGLTASALSAEAIDALAAYSAGAPLPGHPFDVIARYEGASGVGLRGGGAAIGTAFRYLALKQEGAPKPQLDAARADVVAAIEATHVAVAITGVPGRIARGIGRLKLSDGTPVPGTPPVVVPLFDAGGKPLPEPKNNGADRADNSMGALPPGMWYWQDSCSKDQLVGWALAMATLYDAAAGDPDIAPALVEQLRADARDVGAMLREKRAMTALDGEEYTYDLIIMDADGRPTQHHDLNPHGIDGFWAAPGSGIYNVFNAVMALGIVKALYHVSGDPEAGAFLYDELIGQRCYHALLDPASIPCPGGWPEGVAPIDTGLDYVYAGVSTNFSNVNMAAIALFLNLWLEKDELTTAPVRAYMESSFWAPDGVAQAASRIDQPYFEALYALTTAEGYDSARAGHVGDLLMQYDLLPYTGALRENCDAAELAAMSCLAVDGTTTLAVGPKPNRGGHPVATTPLPPSIRQPSNFDARSDPFQVNGGGDALGLNPGGDLNAAYWMLRYAPARAKGTILRSPNARGRVVAPIADPPEVPSRAEPAPEVQAAPSGDSGGCAAAPSRGAAAAWLVLGALGLLLVVRPGVAAATCRRAGPESPR